MTATSPPGANIDLKLLSVERLGGHLWKEEAFSLIQGQGKELGAAFSGAKPQTG